MRDSQKPDRVSLSSMVDHLRDGRYVIPDFQRDFEWKPWDIQELMRSIFRDYYIGSLLLWRGKQENFDALACQPIYGFPQERDCDPAHIVLDGQQRLTAMYYAFLAPDVPVPNRQNRFLYFILVDRFMQEAYDEAFMYDWTQRGINLVADRNAQFEGHFFPLSVVGQGGWALADWCRDYRHFWQEHAAGLRDTGNVAGALAADRHEENARMFGEYVRSIIHEYQISYIELDRDLELDKVCDIFTQVNSRGIRLDIFDLINALLRPKGLRLKHMWQEAAPRLDFVESERMNIYVLQVMSILRQAYCSPKYLYYLLPGQEKKVRRSDGSLGSEVLVADTDAFEAMWDGAVKALQHAVGLLRHPHEFGVISSQYLPYVSIMPAFAALQAVAQTLPASRKLAAQGKFRRWYWASVFLNRYSGSVESTTTRDYLDMLTWFDDDMAEPGLIAEFRARFKTLELRRETRRGTSIYNGIFNLLVLNEARDWMTGQVPKPGDLDDHHIVPRDWCKEQKIGSAMDSILNRTPLTADSNRNVISNRLPNEYLPDLIVNSGESTVRAILESHFISPHAFDILCRDPFGSDDFEDFLAERSRTLQEAIEDLLIKERLRLPPQLRELDAQLEAVELSLRRRIAETLGDDAARLPPHVSLKVDERLRAAAKKNPALDLNGYAALSHRLEYADLRELQDTILSKSTWPLFTVRFFTKEVLAKRFDQLAELRNCIRHSRMVDEITRKEGEAALIWFEQVLAGAD